MSLKNSLRKIIFAFQAGHQERFIEGVREIIVDERRRGHTRVAEEIENALQEVAQPTLLTDSHSMGRLTPPQSVAIATNVPKSKVDNLPLLEVKHPSLSFDDIVVNHTIKKRLNRVVHEHMSRSSLSQYGLEPVSKVLFYGPPGCGKTLSAHVLAGVLGWPLLYVRFDSVVSSYLGETSVNLRRIFEFADRAPCILFFDEFDAIGKSRNEQGDVGELKRVVNTFLQMMDNYHGDGLIIAATNHENLLDSALWRRFDEIVHFERPAPHEIEFLLRMRLGGVRLYDFNTENVAHHFESLSYSAITRICIDAIKHMVLTSHTQLSEQDLLGTLESYRENRPTVL